MDTDYIRLEDHPNKDKIIEIRDRVIEEFKNRFKNEQLPGMYFYITCNDYLSIIGLEFRLEMELEEESFIIRFDAAETQVLQEMIKTFNDLVAEADQEIQEFLF